MNKHIFQESENISKCNGYKFIFNNKEELDLLPFIKQRGIFRKLNNRIIKTYHVCRDCSDPLTNNYTQGIGICATCYNK